MPPIRHVLTLSDIHAGSVVGLLPPGFETLEGNTVAQNRGQKWLWECWLDFQQWAFSKIGNAPFALVLNGDLIEGNHHRTTQIISPDVADHIAAAKLALADIAGRAAKVFVVRGTECHVGSGEHSIAAALGAEADPETGRRVFDRLTIDVDGVRCVWRHHVSTTARPYLEASGLSIMLGCEIVEAARNGDPIPRVVCAAHRHRFGAFTDGHSLACITPAWQGLTTHGHKVVSGARCNPGGYLLDFTSPTTRGLPKCHERIYQAPVPKAVTL